MNAVDMWLVVAAVLFAIAVIVGFLAERPGVVAARMATMPFIAAGLLCTTIAALVARN